jgi:hypothetical protein
MARKKTPSKINKKKVKEDSKDIVVQPEVAVQPEDDDVFAPASLHGELFWEYRAKTSEYEKALLEYTVSSKELKQELSDPKYKKILELMAREESLKSQLKEQANLLRGAQVKAATKLGMTIERFLTACSIDHDTGVVRILD